MIPKYDSMKTSSFSVFSILFLVSAFSCTSKTTANSDTAQEDDVTPTETESFYFMSDDGSFLFRYQNTDEGADLTDMKTDTTYHLTLARSASGARFTDENGHVFWNKGDEFMWMKGDSTITSGHKTEPQ